MVMSDFIVSFYSCFGFILRIGFYLCIIHRYVCLTHVYNRPFNRTLVLLKATTAIVMLWNGTWNALIS